MREMWQGYSTAQGGRIQKVAFGDTGNLDAFSRLRVSEAETLFEAQCQYNAEPLKLEPFNSGDGLAPAYDTATRMVTLEIAAGAAGGESGLQSFLYVPYQPGKSSLIALTGHMHDAVAGAIKRYGYGDAENGIFYEQNGVAGVQFRLRSSTTGAPVDEVVTQANWNLDRLDGTGPSGITLAQDKDFILIIDLQFLGMGRVRIGFDIGGEVIYGHEFLCANIKDEAYMQSATLPILAQISAAAGLAANVDSHFKCAQVSSEAGFDIPLGRPFSCEGNVTAANGSRTHILSIRPRLLFNTITNRISIVIESLEVLAGLNPVYWELVVGGAFTAGPVWSDVDTTYSAFQKGLPASTWNGASTPTVLASGYVGSSASVRGAISKDLTLAYPITLNRAGAVRALGTLHLLLTGISNTSASRAAFNWREIH